MPTINVLTFNVFENGLACRVSHHGSLKPRLSLVSLGSYPLTFLQRHRRFVLSICVRHTVLLTHLCQETQKKNELFFHLRKKAYLCSWTITS